MKQNKYMPGSDQTFLFCMADIFLRQFIWQIQARKQKLFKLIAKHKSRFREKSKLKKKKRIHRKGFCLSLCTVPSERMWLFVSACPVTKPVLILADT